MPLLLPLLLPLPDPACPCLPPPAPACPCQAQRYSQPPAPAGPPTQAPTSPAGRRNGSAPAPLGQAPSPYPAQASSPRPLPGPSPAHALASSPHPDSPRGGGIGPGFLARASMDPGMRPGQQGQAGGAAAAATGRGQGLTRWSIATDGAMAAAQRPGWPELLPQPPGGGPPSPAFNFNPSSDGSGPLSTASPSGRPPVRSNLSLSPSPSGRQFVFSPSAQPHGHAGSPGHGLSQLGLGPGPGSMPRPGSQVASSSIPPTGPASLATGRESGALDAPAEASGKWEGDPSTPTHFQSKTTRPKWYGLLGFRAW